jgi:hypothetical protein
LIAGALGKLSGMAMKENKGWYATLLHWAVSAGSQMRARTNRMQLGP